MYVKGGLLPPFLLRKELGKMFFSHKDRKTGYKKLLSTHHQEVYQIVSQILKDIPITTGYKKDIELICKISAISHDFGKYTSFFQTYLDTEEQSDLKQHSFISALFGSFILSKEREIGNITLPYAELIIYEAILHHHGNLRTVSEDIAPKRDLIGNDSYDLLPRVQILKKQMNDIKSNLSSINENFQPLLSLINMENNSLIEEFFDSWIDVMDIIYKQHYQLKRKAKKKENSDLIDDIYYYLLLVYSILLNADKYSAADIDMKTFSRVDIPADLVDRYRVDKFDVVTKTGTNGWRNKIYDTVMKKIDLNRDKLDVQRLYTLTAPTGSGKTLLSLSVAFKWRKWIKETKGYTPRIIYSLPFTSVIDQNEQQIQKLLEQLPDYKGNRHRYLIKHHHLTTIEYIKENEELPLSQSLLLTESWESEIVVTTFIQLFYTLIGYENRALKKFHQIAGSIIILDEIQNIPVEYWPLLRIVLTKMAELFSCTFILLTATQPLIFENGETVELLENKYADNKSFFREIERVSLSLFVDEHTREYELDEWVEMFKGSFEEGNNYLSIFNTIHTSLRAYQKLSTFLKEYGYEVFYLSTNIIPLERKERIEKIMRALKDKKRVAVFSTQVVEAGVDLDFHIVYRDLGPIDSIIQGAGRSNRNGSLEKIGRLGEVRVTPIVRNGVLESTMVYKSIHTNVAKNILPYGDIQEHQFIDLIEKYYRQLKTQKLTDEWEKIFNAMRGLRFSSKSKSLGDFFVSEFSLITDNPLMIDTFIEIDEEAENTWKKYLEQVVYEQDFKKRFEANIKLKTGLRKYIISAPIRIVKNLKDEETMRTRMIRIRRDILDQYYNEDFGLIRSAEDGEVFLV